MFFWERLCRGVYGSGGEESGGPEGRQNQHGMCTCNLETLAPDGLEHELQRELHDACGLGGSHKPELRVIDVSVRIVELRMIEDVECFCAELRRYAFGDLRLFQQGEVKVIETSVQRNTGA